MFVFEYLKGNYFRYRENVTLILYFDFRENITGIVQTPIPMKKVCQRRGLEGKGLILIFTTWCFSFFCFLTEGKTVNIFPPIVL